MSISVHQPKAEGRRVKVIPLPVDTILTLLTQPQSKYMRRIRFGGIPDGCDVVGISANPYAQCIDVIVQHESFPETFEGEQPPRLSMMDACVETFEAAYCLDQGEYEQWEKDGLKVYVPVQPAESLLTPAVPSAQEQFEAALS